jgi:ribulose-5-phosphate 4-epimerase/fuculose-1-phosphate aldolase
MNPQPPPPPRRSPRPAVTKSLTPQAQLALLARMLQREGYNDHHAGHLSYKQPDGTLLVAPWELTWEEVRASDILRVDMEGRVLEGVGTPNPALSLHYELYRRRPDVNVAVHNHPLWATVWSVLREIPPIYEQFGAFVTDDIALYADFEGGVSQDEGLQARRNVDALGTSHSALLSNHGVFVLADTIEWAHLRAVVLETRCRIAWYVQALGESRGTPLSEAAAKKLAHLFEVEFGGWPHFFEAMARKEVTLDPSVLD